MDFEGQAFEIHDDFLFFIYFLNRLLLVSRPPGLRVNHAPLHFRFKANPPAWTCESSTQTTEATVGKDDNTQLKTKTSPSISVLALAGR